MSSLQYKYHSYDDIISIFTSLAISCSQYVQIDYAESRYNLSYLNTTFCGNNNPCRNLIVYLTDFNTYTTDRPQFYGSGLVHGDEVIGPSTITEFVMYFCNNNQSNNSHFIKNILKQKLFIFTPMTNAYGYYHNQRDDIDLFNKKLRSFIDPNRDFGYNNDQCMMTMTGRTVNAIFNEFLIQSAITFHGGINVLGYPWGNFKHINENISTKAPDHSIFQAFGSRMRNVSSSVVNSKNNITDYVLGDMTSTVYAVDGGMEDWAYAGGWEKENIKQCAKSINQKEANGDSLKCVIFLAETDHQKRPLEMTLGIKNDTTVFNFTNKDFYGHIPRNMRMIYVTADLISAYFYMNITFNEEGTKELEVIVMGCESVMTVYQYEIEYDHSFTREFAMSLDKGKNEPIATYENVICYWKDNNKRIRIPLANINNDKDNGLNATENPIMFTKNKVIYFKGMNPDQEWAKQINPDPNIPPQTHVIKSKTNSSYHIINDNYSIQSNNIFLSYPVLLYKDNHIILDDIDAFLYSNNSLTLLPLLTINSKSKHQLITRVKVILNQTQMNLYSSEINYNLSLVIMIGQEWDINSEKGMLSKGNFIQVLSKIDLSNNNDDYERITANCQIYYQVNNNKKFITNSEASVLIKCMNIMANINGAFIRNRIVNSIITINWSFNQSNKENDQYAFNGIFSMNNLEYGKALTINNLNSSLQCNSHISMLNPNNLFSITIVKYSNKLLNISMSLAKGVYDNLDKVSYFILFPYTDDFILLNNTNQMTTNISLTIGDSKGRIIGKILYVIKIQSDADKTILEKLLNKEMNYTQRLSFIESQRNLTKMSVCSIRKINLLNDNNDNNNTSISKSLNQIINQYLLWFVIGLNILGGIALIICCIMKLKRRFFVGYNQLNSRVEMETIEIQDIRNQ